MNQDGIHGAARRTRITNKSAVTSLLVMGTVLLIYYSAIYVTIGDFI